MTGAENIVRKISGKPYLSCYEVLCRAVEVAYEYRPAQPAMKDLIDAVVPRLRKKRSAMAVSRAQGRAVEDIWENGDRTILEKTCGFCAKPFPKELVFALALFLERNSRYRLWKEESSGKYGILAGEPDHTYWMAAAPFLKDEEQAAAIVRVLNESDLSCEQFRELFLSGELIGVMKDGRELEI